MTSDDNDDHDERTVRAAVCCVQKVTSCETLRTLFSSATADRNMGAGLYVQNMSSSNGKNTASLTRSIAVREEGGGGAFL